MGEHTDLTRRTALQGISAILGAPALASLGALPAHAKFLDSTYLEFVTAVADTLIPETDTPGAAASGVPLYFDGMMETWASPETVAHLKKALSDLRQTLGGSFTTADMAERTAALSAYDTEAFTSKREERRGYRDLKNLLVSIYYATEAGASVELQYELVPGEWLPCAPLDEIGRSWSR